VTIADLQGRLRVFAQEREWEQFHIPKNLVMALAGEVGELSELFQWLTPEQSQSLMADRSRADEVKQELADIFGYLLRLADVLGVDLEEALNQKIAQNANKYPVEASKGNAIKYTHLGGRQ
jgi:dCTP diphosphatase